MIERIAVARKFKLQRDEDLHGKSGTGIVAEGIEFSDGTVSMRWISDTATTVQFDSIEDVEKIHGHEGRTKLVFEDGEVKTASPVDQKFREIVARVYVQDKTKEDTYTLDDVLDRIQNKPKDMSVIETQDYLDEVGFKFDPLSQDLDQIR